MLTTDRCTLEVERGSGDKANLDDSLRKEKDLKGLILKLKFEGFLLTSPDMYFILFLQYFIYAFIGIITTLV